MASQPGKGFVFQSYNLVPVLTVQENIVLPIQLDGQQRNIPLWNGCGRKKLLIVPVCIRP